MFTNKTNSYFTQLLTEPIKLYIHFIGDKSINDKDFGKIVKDRKEEMIEYLDIINKKASEENQTKYIAFNNHFAGFGPQSANTFLKLISLR